VGGAGQKSDASVGTVLDVASDMVFVVEQRRFVGIPFAQLQREIERMAFQYMPAPTVIEMSGIGQSVAGNVELREPRLIEFWTTERSKARIIGNVQLALEQKTLKFDHNVIPQLAKELRGYTTPDTYCQTDTVMSLAITLGCAGEAYVRPGRVMSIIHA
jgi:terminase large subunit-like protein